MSIRCQVIGVLDNGRDGLTPQALQALQQARVVIGGQRTLQLFKDVMRDDAQHYDLGGAITAVPQWITQALNDQLPVVVLATGDPLCHGIGSYLYKKLGRNQIEIVPNVSTMQLACARLGVAWPSLHICSIHSVDAGEWQVGATPQHGLYPLMQALTQHDLIGVFTSPENSPQRIARLLQTENLADQFSLSVCSRLLQGDESVLADVDMAQAATQSFDDPNVVILQRRTPRTAPVLFGLSDASYAQRKPEKGLITKREVRALSLALMQLRSDSIVWDIGAGSGSVGLEAARLAPRGHVYAIEKNIDDHAIVQQNRVALDVHNYTLVHGKAPQGMEAWPQADAIFIGGSGGELATLIERCLQSLRAQGNLVMNFVTLENLGTAIATLKQLGAQWQVTQMNCSRSQPILHMQRMAAENPVWIICAQTAQQGE